MERPFPDGHYKMFPHLIQQLPRDQKWTKHKRDRWLQAMAAALDLLIEIESPVANASASETNEAESVD